MTAVPRPLNLIAELTYRCPLRCPYCSNPLQLRDFPDALSAEDWGRVFGEAAALGIVHVGLTGGEPSARRDLPEIVRRAEAAGLYTHLVTAGMPLSADGLAELQRAGLCSVQVSLQDSRPAESDAIAGAESFARKLAIARAARRLGLPLTLNFVLHRHNLARVEEIIALARRENADRLELANAQYQGWALANRAALLPSRAQIEAAAQAAARARRESPRPEILFVLPDYFRGRPKPCMGGWARTHIVVTPDGRALPCHGAAALPGLEFWNVRERPLADCWCRAPGMNAFRGEDWMRDPCRSCPERSRDFGGCRCQSAALLGDPAATDPACSLSPHHSAIQSALSDPATATPAWRYRTPTGPPAPPAAHAMRRVL
ncbi:MAG: pyrroloquinoline quinone biosynthesis protein PqqE [Deltaproteobacteria bacterium]|nr:pyrroloquinoline quinone biosynthesis protein PqqE [Deltaproteobacteria bacterium]